MDSTHKAKVVMKNNAAECVLMSPQEYVQLIDEVNDARLLAEAAERMTHFDPNASHILLLCQAEDSSGLLLSLSLPECVGFHPRLEGHPILQADIMIIVVIGARADDDVYNIAHQRIQGHGL